MDRHVFGHPAFESKEDALEYLRTGLRDDNGMRYRHNLCRNEVDSIIFSYEGELLGELVVENAVAPSNEDKENWPPTKKVYIIREIRIFRDGPVRAADFGLTGLQFGKRITDSMYTRILKAANGFDVVSGT